MKEEGPFNVNYAIANGSITFVVISSVSFHNTTG